LIFSEISSEAFSKVPSEARDPYRLPKKHFRARFESDDCGCLDSFVRGEILASIGFPRVGSELHKSMNFLLSAGEASGDTYGAQLIDALRDLAPGSTFFGMGGEKMRASGCELLVHANEVAVVGLVEVIRHLPDIRRRFKHLVAEAAKRKPDAAILIDFPDFNLRLARELHRLGIPVFYFVSPQIWAWRTGRVKQIQKYVRKMIVIFPFEQEFYARHGVEVSYVGHPLAYVPPPQISREEFAAKYQLDSRKHWIALLPGSRRKEVRLNLPAMVEAANLLRKQSAEFEFLLPVASTLNPEWLHEQLALSTAGWSRPSGLRKGPYESPALATGVSNHKGDFPIRLTHNARATLVHSRAAVVASGTATVEAALSGTPFVVVYRLAPLTWLLGRRLVKLDTFAMPNLIAGKKIVPELIQKDFTAQNVFWELNAIIPEGLARRQMEADLKMVQQRLRDTQHSESPAERAAREILGALAKV
jgi:lipid-A-disaccharide synthase